MNSRLAFVQTWETLAQEAGYRPSFLAGRCGYSLRTLERHFRKSYGKTVHQWLKELRLKKAYAALQSGDKAVKEVAFDFGYKQMSHFSREFKSLHGFPPSLLLVRQNRVERAAAYRQDSPSSPQMIFTF